MDRSTETQKLPSVVLTKRSSRGTPESSSSDTGAMRPDEFQAGLVILQSAAAVTMPRQQQEAWYALAKHLTGAQWLNGCTEAARTHQFAGLPPIGRVLALAGEKSEPTTKQRAVVAWDCVLDAVSRVGGYRTVKFDDPVIHATINAIAGQGGWLKLCECNSEDLRTWKRKEFLETYEVLCATGIRQESTQPLIGIIGVDASARGFDAPEITEVKTGLPAPQVKLIGNSHTTTPTDAVKKLAESFGAIE